MLIIIFLSVCLTYFFIYFCGNFNESIVHLHWVTLSIKKTGETSLLLYSHLTNMNSNNIYFLSTVMLPVEKKKRNFNSPAEHLYLLQCLNDFLIFLFTILSYTIYHKTVQAMSWIVKTELEIVYLMENI